MPQLVVVIPIGPHRAREYIADTVESLSHFLPDARYIVVDDTGTGLGAQLGLPDATVLPNPGSAGRNGLLFRRLSCAYEEALREPFDLLLRIDEDAVVLGNTFVDRALSFFSERREVGLLGLHHKQYLEDHRDFGWPASRLKRLLVGDLARSDPRRTVRMWQLFLRARRQGYTRGEHVLSAVSLWRPDALRRISAAGILGDERLVRSGLTEDHLFGIGVRSVGYAMHGFGTGNDDRPLAVAWKGLPASPSEIMAAGKELVHSTKTWAGRDEADVREAFRLARTKPGARAPVGHGDRASSAASATVPLGGGRPVPARP